MNALEKALEEYCITGHIVSCPKCGKHTVYTNGYVNGNRGSVDVRCSSCGMNEHYDGFSYMHDHADPQTITHFS